MTFKLIEVATPWERVRAVVSVVEAFCLIIPLRQMVVAGD